MFLAFQNQIFIRLNQTKLLSGLGAIMMHILLSILVLCVSGTIQCAALEKPSTLEFEEPLTQPLPFATNGLLIFLDQGNETGDKIGVVGYELLVALSQKPCAILASRLLIRDIIKQPTPKEFAKKLKDEGSPKAQDYEKLAESTEAIKNYLATTSSNPSYWEELAIVNAINSMVPKEFKDENKAVDLDFHYALSKELYIFNPDEWIIKQVGHQLVLLVPKEYINKLNANNFAQYYSQDTYSPTELNLGIKIDHLPTVASIETYANEYKAPAETSSGKFLLDSLANLFITRAEYKQISKQKLSTAHLPQWTLYLMGHGDYGSIVNMTLDHFKQLLAFFDAKIVTKLVTYLSCYAAGSNTQKIYGDLKSAGLKTNPYAVVTAALTDAPVRISVSYAIENFSTSDINFKNHTLKPTYDLHFKQFIDMTAQENSINFKQLLQHLFPARLLNNPNLIFGSPQIKLPGIEWFDLVDIDNNIVSIGQTLAASRSANQPLNILNFFGKKLVHAILLYSNIVPFELIIPIPRMPIIVPMIPGNSYHEFAAITVNTTLKDFFAVFAPLKEIQYRKNIVIKKLKVTGEAQSGQGETEFKNVLITAGGDLFFQYATDKLGTTFQWDSAANKLKPYLDYMPTLYSIEEEQLEKAQEKIKQIEQIRKAQEKKIKEIHEKTPPEQLKFEQFRAKTKQFKTRVESFIEYKFQGFDQWMTAKNQEQKNEAITLLGKNILDKLAQFKKMGFGKRNLLGAYDFMTQDLKLFFNEFTGEYDPEIKQEIEKKLEDFKNKEILTM